MQLGRPNYLDLYIFVSFIDYYCVNYNVLNEAPQGINQFVHPLYLASHSKPGSTSLESPEFRLEEVLLVDAFSAFFRVYKL